MTEEQEQPEAPSHNANPAADSPFMLALKTMKQIINIPTPSPDDMSAESQLILALKEAIFYVVDNYLSPIYGTEQPQVDPRQKRADMLLDWLKAQPGGRAGFRKVLQFGPPQTRAKADADDALAILQERGQVETSAGRPRTIRIVAPTDRN